VTQEALDHDETGETIAQPDNDPQEQFSPEDATLELLRAIADAVQRRENPAPSSFFSTQFPTTVSLRLTVFVFSTTAAAAVTIRFGPALYYTFNTPGAFTGFVPLSVELKEGTDVTVAASAGTVTWYFLGYPE
jgi:hypothetical protein